MNTILQLEGRLVPRDEYSGSTIYYKPLWSMVEDALDYAFKNGNEEVRLSAFKFDEHDSENDGVDAIVIQANVGRYRFLVFPAKEKLGEKSKLREWWQPGDLPYQGTEVFNDHPWDTRTVCTDIAIAKAFFRDFFDHKGLTDFIMQNTLSCWDNPTTREMALNIGQFAKP